MHEHTQFGHSRHLVDLCLMSFTYLTDFPIRMLEKVCKDPQMLADVFVNYDCDLEGPNLFERTVIIFFKCPENIASEFLIKCVFFFGLQHI